ncbi:ZIP family metal transporter [Polymorphobacter fuscus]|uniref:ZIP family metal transporter n=1 Tax=Sandarakinorhabdus fusca TaxID=1439888 RepID=A0A7C9GS44_9SPHN|nr:ZIP family metal transporter [Polymorphobacter fuscus]KAB7646381.1 ZIP family metal transporter [Polymorphobacter fuscus]MQT17611.1 ZIP family metal transporter [Polymorphobacter fuscus]NJC09846.1 ZIP family zinc transporter [Polymorphobacter fuscus]
MSPIFAGFLASLIAGLATGVGALPVLAMRGVDAARQSLLLGFAAGAMLAASVFSLILPGFEQARVMGSDIADATLTMAAAVLIGGFAMSQLGALLPQMDSGRLAPVAGTSQRARSVWLFVAAITFHNIPEGAAVGVAFGGDSLRAGLPTAIGIGIQNMPEGLAVAGALVALGYTRLRAVQVALATGLVEPIAGLAGALVVAAATSLLPWGLGIAAGAMLFIVLSEIVPDLDLGVRVGQRGATAALAIGLALMTFLDTAIV